jgi:hypothetical protein
MGDGLAHGIHLTFQGSDRLEFGGGIPHAVAGFAGGLGGASGQLPDLIGDHDETGAGLTDAGRLNGGIEGERTLSCC